MISPFQEPLLIDPVGNPTRFYDTALLRDKADLSMAATHKVRYGDRFDNLAFLYYKTPTLWWYIAKANGVVDGSLTPPVGTTIFIPRL